MSFDLSEQIELAASALPDDGALDQVRRLAEQLEGVEKRIERGEALLKQLNAQAHLLRTKDLPDAMIAANVKKLTLNNGCELSREAKYFSAIPTIAACEKKPELWAKREAAFQWLRDNNQGALIKTSLEINLDKTDQGKLEPFLELARQLGIDAQQGDNVHYKSLESFVKEWHLKGQPLPAELGASTMQVAKIK